MGKLAYPLRGEMKEKRGKVLRARVNDEQWEVAVYVAKRLGLRISDTIRFVLWDWYQRLKREE